MTPAQFDCCTTGASKKGAEAARLVLVEGMGIAEAAERVGIKPQSVSNALARIRKAAALFRVAYGQAAPDDSPIAGRDETPPREIIDAERKVSAWFAERNIREWQLGGSRSRGNE